MTDSAISRMRYKPDWRWVIVSYCWLVLFHMFPTFLLGGLRLFESRVNDPATIIWLLFGLVLVSMFIGYRSKGFTVLEPAIAGFAYSLTMSLGFDRFIATSVQSEKSLAILFWAVLSFIICVVSAWIGELVQEWGKKSRESAQEARSQ